MSGMVASWSTDYCWTVVPKFDILPEPTPGISLNTHGQSMKGRVGRVKLQSPASIGVSIGYSPPKAV